MNFEMHYGINPMTFEEELNAPMNTQIIRSQKVVCIDELERIIQMAQAQIERVRDIPEDSDDEHTEIVNQYAKHVESSLKAMERACNYKII